MSPVECRAAGSRALVLLGAACVLSGLVAWGCYEHIGPASMRTPTLALYAQPAGLQRPVVVPGQRLAPEALPSIKLPAFSPARFPAAPAAPVAQPSVMAPTTVESPGAQMPIGQPSMDTTPQSLPAAEDSSNTEALKGPPQILFWCLAASVAVGITITGKRIKDRLQNSGDFLDVGASHDSLELRMIRGRAGVPTMRDSDPVTENLANRLPWYDQDTNYTEENRKERRTIFMHNEWVRHRSSDRFFRNLKNIGSSGINQALRKELTFVTMGALFVVIWNMLFVSYQDFGGVSHAGPLAWFPVLNFSMSVNPLPFTIASPALSLLLVFRTNNGYSRWNESRTLWGGLINTCRNVVRQANGFFPKDEKHYQLKRQLASETVAFIRSLRNFLRGATDDDTLRHELYDEVQKGYLSLDFANDVMAASNRPMYCVAAMSATLRKADISEMHSARMDQSFSTLVDLLGANERIFKSPIPLVYTRLTSRFLSLYLILLPLALWPALSGSWNHWATVPAEFILAFFLFGIEEVGIQTEEPFSVLPLEAFCNGAIAATNEEILKAENEGAYELSAMAPSPQDTTRDPSRSLADVRL